MVSAAEERIRTKAEAGLREAWPSARIIHELVVHQGSCRLDLAAVTLDRIVLVEVKSERDVLTRLEKQYREAQAVSDAVVVACAAEHVRAAQRLLHTCGLVVGEDALPDAMRYTTTDAYRSTCNSPARLAMLWAEELRVVARTGPRDPRQFSITKGSEYMTGNEVRRGVCAALRARVFPRADPPMLSELFPEPTRSTF